MSSRSIEQVLRKELAQVETSRNLRLAPDPVRAPATNTLVGLAFSGGGIRSATFNLGVLQGLAKNQLLHVFDYLSTVSGGGYIGSWLMAWMHHQEIGINAVEEALRTPPTSPKEAADPPEVHFLRDYSNYLTPRRGVLGADLWAFLASYLRNMLLNQMILVMLLLSVLLLPRLLVFILHSLESAEEAIEAWRYLSWFQAEKFAIVIGAILSWRAVLFIGRNLFSLEPSRPNPKNQAPQEARYPAYAQPKAVHRGIILPLFAASALFAYGFGQLLAWNAFTQHPLVAPAIMGIVLYGGLWAGALAFRGSFDMKARVSGPAGPPAWAILFTAGITGAISGYLFLPYTRVVFNGGIFDGVPYSKWHLLTYGTPALVLIMLASGVLHIGLLGRGLSDGYREWFARLGGWLLIYSFVWIGLFSIAIYMPSWLKHLWVWETARHPSHTLTGASVLTWVGSTAYGVFFGRSSATGFLSANSPRKAKVFHYFACVAPYVFIIGLLIALSLLAAQISMALTPWDPTIVESASGCWVDANAHTPAPSIFSVPSDCRFDTKVPLACLIFFLGAVLLSWRVDINQFSVHKLYRNRLVRCYLGASVLGRVAQPFNGFSSADDVPLAQLKIPLGSKQKKHGRPLPILNTSLNVVRGKELALQTRKARSFVCTPWYSGFTRQTPNARSIESAYAKTGNLGNKRTESPTNRQGLTLGTAMAISGAAASPNMGFYSTPALAFLMTVFDVRLGWWMGNPGCPSWCKAVLLLVSNGCSRNWRAQQQIRETTSTSPTAATLKTLPSMNWSVAAANSSSPAMLRAIAATPSGTCTMPWSAAAPISASRSSSTQET